jgi:hypothetical protein
MKFFRFSLLIFVYFSFLTAALDVLGLFRLWSHIELLVVAISWSLMFAGIAKLRLLKETTFSTFDRFILFAFFLVCFVAILRSVSLPLSLPKSIPRYLGGVFFIAAWVCPLFIYFGSQINIWKEVWKLSKTYSRFFIILSPFLYFSRYYINLSLFVPLLIMNWHAVNKKYRLITILSFIIACAYFVYAAERNMLARFAFYPIAYYLFLLFYKIPNRSPKIVMMSVAFVIGIIILIPLYNGTIRKSVTDPGLKERLEQYEKKNLNADSRDLVYNDFFNDFKKDDDWLLGRGLLGPTYSDDFIIIQILDAHEGDVFGFPMGYRTEIECGYLMYILKVGLIGLGLFLIIALRAIWLGLFESANYFVKAFAFIITEWLISMYPYGIPEYHPSYILFWLCVGACLSRKVRSLSNADIKQLVYT